MRKWYFWTWTSTDDSGSRMNGNKRVFMVTDNDEPPGSSSTRQAARTTFGVGYQSWIEKGISWLSGSRYIRNNDQHLLRGPSDSSIQPDYLLERTQFLLFNAPRTNGRISWIEMRIKMTLQARSPMKKVYRSYSRSWMIWSSSKLQKGCSSVYRSRLGERTGILKLVFLGKLCLPHELKADG